MTGNASWRRSQIARQMDHLHRFCAIVGTVAQIEVCNGRRVDVVVEQRAIAVDPSADERRRGIQEAFGALVKSRRAQQLRVLVRGINGAGERGIGGIVARDVVVEIRVC